MTKEKSDVLYLASQAKKSKPDIDFLCFIFKDAFDHKAAENTGKIIPKKGVDEDYDKALKDRLEHEQDLDDYLRDQKRFFGSPDVKYFGSGNNMYQLEVAENVANKKIDSSYTLSSQRKGFKRFTTDETREFLGYFTEIVLSKRKVGKNCEPQNLTQSERFDTFCVKFHRVRLFQRPKTMFSEAIYLIKFCFQQ